MFESATNSWERIPCELRQRPQWCISPGTDDDKAPRTASGAYADSTDPTTWGDFDTACSEASKRGWHIGYMLHGNDPFTCIDLDVKDSTTPDQIARFEHIISKFDSYCEQSRSGRGWHVFVEGNIGKGKRSRDGVEVYSQERFIICTGNTVRQRPIADQREMLGMLLSEMTSSPSPSIELWGDDCADWGAATRAAEDTGDMGQLFAGVWEGQYQSQSEADLALVKFLLPLTESPNECWCTFQLSKLGKRNKAKRPDYARSTIARAMQHLESDALQAQHGARMAAGLLGDGTPVDADLLDKLTIDWANEEDADVPDIVDGLVADEDVTLVGGHGGVGKGFLALQMACAVALGLTVLGCPTRRCRVLYYSAEDGRKRMTRRLRRIAETFDYNADSLRANLRVLDASELEPLYGEKLEQSSDGKRFAKILGPTADFDNLREMVARFDPQLVIVDGASDTFDGNEIARREVRAFIKMLRRLHPHRKVGVMVIVHIDRSSARGNVTNDDGYAGSAQWHNSCRRRLFLHHQVKKEWEDGEQVIVDEKIVLRIMKNQDGAPAPDIELQRGEFGLWQMGVEIGGDLSPSNEHNHGVTIAHLIRQYYERGIYMSTSLAAQATTGVYSTLKSDPAFPKKLNRKRTAELVRDLQRHGVLAEEPYKRGNRTSAERWQVMRDPESPFKRFEEAAQVAPNGTR